MSSSTRTDSAPLACQRPIRIRLACTYCHDQLVAAEGEFCAGCLAPHHADCFREHGECSAPGCGARRVVGAPEPTRPAPNYRRRPAFGPLCVMGAFGVASLVLPAVLWKREAMSHRRAEALEARLAEARAENARLEVALAEARAADADRIDPVEGAPGIPIMTNPYWHRDGQGRPYLLSGGAR